MTSKIAGIIMIIIGCVVLGIVYPIMWIVYLILLGLLLMAD